MTVYRGNAALRIGNVVFQRRDFLPDEQAIPIGLYANQPYAAVGEIQHLRRPGIQDQLLDVGAHQLLRAYSHVDRYRVLRKQLVGVHVFGGPNASDLGGRSKLRVRDLAGNHVGFVHVGQRDDDIGIFRAGALQHFGVGGVTDNGSNIQAVLQFPQHVGPQVDDGDFVGLLSRQMVCRGGADLPGTENENFHRA